MKDIMSQMMMPFLALQNPGAIAEMAALKGLQPPTGPGGAPMPGMTPGMPAGGMGLPQGGRTLSMYADPRGAVSSTTLPPPSQLQLDRGTYMGAAGSPRPPTMNTPMAGILQRYRGG